STAWWLTRVFLLALAGWRKTRRTFPEVPEPLDNLSFRKIRGMFVRGDSFSRIAFLQPPLGNLDPLGEPHFGKALGVFDELIDDLGPERNTGDKRMKIESKVFRRPLFPLP